MKDRSIQIKWIARWICIFEEISSGCSNNANLDHFKTWFRKKK